MTNKETVEFFEALKLLAKEKGIDPEYLIERIQAAIVVAVKKDFGGKENIIVRNRSCAYCHAVCASD